MPSIAEIANRDETTPITLHLTNPKGVRFSLDVEFYLNRVTGAVVSEERVTEYLRELGDDEDGEDVPGVTSLRNAIAFCDFMASWDLTGPLEDGSGRTVVPSGEVIPLEPRTVRWVQAWLTGAINDKMLELVYPNLNRSRRARKR